MGIKYIHVVLIGLSIVLCIGFGIWNLNKSYMISAYASFVGAVALSVYCVNFLRKIKAL